MTDTFTNLVLSALRKVASTSAEGWLNGSVGGDPVGKSVFAVLDDTVFAPRSAMIVQRRDGWMIIVRRTPC